MGDPDRRTTLYGDQIKDGTVTNTELETSNTPSNGDSLTYDLGLFKMKWKSVTGDTGWDGGFANSTYLPSQSINGENA